MERRLRAVVARVRWSLRQRGVRGALELVMGRLRRRGRAGVAGPHPFDVEHGVETSGLIGGGALPGGHADDVYSTAYFGVPPSRMRGVLAAWRETAGVLPVEATTFVDVGCGKGRAMLLAAEMTFKEVMGVELNAGLAAIAERNVEAWGARARAPIRVVCGSATEMDLPEGPLLIYFYNSFRAPVLRLLLGRLQAWVAGGGGPVEMLCLFPEEEWVFGEFSGFVRVWKKGIGLAAEDVGVDGISAAEDGCSLYRLRGLPAGRPARAAVTS